MTTVKNKQNKFYRWHVISGLMPAGKPVKGVEVGVWEGECAKHLLQYIPKLFLYMVDTWKIPSNDSDYYISGDSKAVTTQEAHNSAYNKAKKLASIYPQRTKIIRDSSIEAAKTFKDKVDFVFIDGDHTEEAVYSDTKAWLPHVKPGGIICGHDWGRYGVEPAVKRVFGYEFQLSHDTVWWHRKNKHD